MSSDVRPTDRGMWLVVARRDFRVRLHDRGFLISTLITLTVLTVFILLRALGGDGASPITLGVLDGDPLGNQIAALGEQLGIDVRLRDVGDDASAAAAVRDGAVDAALIDGQLVGERSVPPELVQAVQAAAIASRLADVLGEYGVPADAIASLADQSPVDVRVLEAGDPNRDDNIGLAFIGVILLYGQLFGYGVWVATGVIEEKSSRVVELLLSAISPRQLMAGKIVGVGSLGLVQLAFIAVYAIVLALVTGAIGVAGSAIGTAALVIGWFVLGFSFYAGLFAVAGALVSRMEELQNAMTPINLLIFVSFFISVEALRSPDSTLVRVASVLPTSSALAMPVRIVQGAAEPWEIALSLAVVVISTMALVPLAGRLYAGAVLRTGARVKLRDAWRAAA